MKTPCSQCGKNTGENLRGSGMCATCWRHSPESLGMCVRCKEYKHIEKRGMCRACEGAVYVFERIRATEDALSIGESALGAIDRNLPLQVQGALRRIINEVLQQGKILKWVRRSVLSGKIKASAALFNACWKSPDQILDLSVFDDSFSLKRECVSAPLRKSRKQSTTQRAKSEKRELQIQNECIAYARVHGVTESIGNYDGMPDVIFWLGETNTILGWVEFKAPGGKTSSRQEEQILLLRKRGEIARVFNSVGRFKEWLDRRLQSLLV